MRDHPIEEQEGETRWYLREKRPNGEKWKWLRELGFYPVQGPVREGTEEPGLENIGHEAESIPATEVEEGETEREVDLINREKEPKLTASEWNRLKKCERPCTKEEWRAMSTQTQWETLGYLGLLWKREEDGVKGEQEIPGPPKCAKAPPPALPPSTYLRGNPRTESRLGSIDEGTDEGETGKGKKGQQKGLKGKKIPKEKEITWSRNGRRSSRKTQKATIPIRQHTRRIGAGKRTSEMGKRQY